MKRDRESLALPEWVSSKRRGATLVEDLDLLFSDLCVHWGFCGLLADDILESHEILTPDNFATAVLVAEGWSAEDALVPTNWGETMKKVFKARYGAAVSSVDYESSMAG